MYEDSKVINTSEENNSVAVARAVGNILEGMSELDKVVLRHSASIHLANLGYEAILHTYATAKAANDILDEDIVDTFLSETDSDFTPWHPFSELSVGEILDCIDTMALNLKNDFLSLIKKGD